MANNIVAIIHLFEYDKYQISTFLLKPLAKTVCSVSLVSQYILQNCMFIHVWSINLLFLTVMTVSILKGTATLKISIFYKKELYKPWILIPVSSKSVEKCGSC